MIMTLLEQYAQIVGEDVTHHLQLLVANLQGMKVVHFNSTREGGGEKGYGAATSMRAVLSDPSGSSFGSSLNHTPQASGRFPSLPSHCPTLSILSPRASIP